MIDKDMNAVIGAERDAADVQITIVINIGKIGAEHTPITAGRNSIIPGRPVLTGAVA